MPGLCGIVSRIPSGDIASHLTLMADAVSHFDWYARDVFVAPVGDFGLARVHLNLLPAPENRNVGATWLHGERTDGFTLVEYDDASCTVTISNDRFGMMPVYYALTRDALVFSSELKGVLAHPDVDSRLDERALADLLTFGFVLGEKTLVRTVRCLTGGMRLRFNAKNGEVGLERTWDLRDQIGHPARGCPALLEEISECFRHAIQRRTGDVPLSVSLSGGYDSRAIMSAVDHVRTHVQTLTLDVAGGADQCLAEQISRATNGLENHHFVENSDEFFARWPQYLSEMVWLTDGMYYDEACVMMPTLELYRELGAAAVLRGHGGELARMHEAYELRCNRHILACRSQESLKDQLFRQMNLGLHEADFNRLFVPELAREMRGAARASLDEAFTEIDPAWHVIDQVSCLYINEYLRRQCVPSLAQIRSRAEVRMPFLDEDYVAAVLQLPPAMRITSRVHRHILLRNNPALLKITNANTMAPAGAGELTQRISRKAHQILRQYLGYQRYSHYVDISGWFRGPLKGAIEQVLFAAQEDYCEFLNRSAVRELLDGHVAGHRDNGPALMLLLLITSIFRGRLLATNGQCVPAINN